MNKKNKKIIIYIIIILIFIFLFNKISLLLVLKGNTYGTDVLDFYKQDKNSIDMLILGSSHSYSSFNPYLIEEKTGLKTYNFCTQQQPLWITYYYLKEALKTQKPKYVILDLHMAIMTKDNFVDDSINREAIDKMKMSLNKIEAINTSVETLEEKMSYYFNIIKYHSRYKELNTLDFEVAFLNKAIDNKGYIALKEIGFKFEPPLKQNIFDIEKPLDKSIIYLEKIIEICKNNDIKLILVKTPCNIYNETEYKNLNYLKLFAEKNEIEFYDYVNNINDLNLDFDSDFYDPEHLNKNGSIKFTNYFINQLNQLNI